MDAIYSQCSFNVTTWLVPDVRKQSHCDAGILSEIVLRTNPINLRSLSLWFSLLTCSAFPHHAITRSARSRLFRQGWESLQISPRGRWTCTRDIHCPSTSILKPCRVSKFRIAAEDQMNGSCMVMVRNTAFAGGSWWKVSLLGGSKWDPVRFAWMAWIL